MKKVALFIFAIAIVSSTFAQKTPDVIYGPLFKAVQESNIFSDSKTFVDAVPKSDAAAIVRDYLSQSKSVAFSLADFVNENFTLQAQPKVVNEQQGKPIEQHIKELWTVLKRAQDKKVQGSSLLALPQPYIVPGGRFTEVYYWDGYFTMLGLKEHGEVKTIENMVDNFAFLIKTYGHIPNGNRSYYLSRSQPPFFSMMVDLLASIKGKSIYKKYLPALQQEYDFWMEGADKVKAGGAFKRVARLKNGFLLNRYCDNLDIPRQEGYKEDFKTAQEAAVKEMAVMRFANETAMNKHREMVHKRTYKDLRSAAESGWDFSGRWFDDVNDLSTIRTTSIAPVDLNSLIYHLEQVLIEHGGKVNKTIHQNREILLLNIFFNKSVGFYTDIDLHTNQPIDKVTAAGFFPIHFLPYTKFERQKVAANIISTAKRELIKPGGIVTTPNTTGQQWDAPNGWAPLQWMGIMAIEKLGDKGLAKSVAQSWINLNKKIYDATGKLTEKYNVVDLTLETGGGEYPNLDGFGWTNGVYMALIKRYNL